MDKTLKYPAWKRTTDLIVSIAIILEVLPLLFLVAIAIKIDSRGPVLVRCKRLSGGREIKAYKFRSMVLGAESQKKELEYLNDRKDGPFFKIKKDPRVTRVGRILRATLIDEIPQVINVLKGEMAIVGPRPHEPMEVEKYPDEYKHLPLARAGITGVSQVSGASSLNWMKELELDSEYLQNINFRNDFRIILKTLAIFFSKPKGV
jgi:lipopolysaccharide/colanic/teichoic acid biosynthesis glycosyltransferase